MKFFQRSSPHSSSQVMIHHELTGTLYGTLTFILSCDINEAFYVFLLSSA